MNADRRPDLHALLELDALLSEITSLRDSGDPMRYGADSHYRWILHRLWIAAGNEALAYATATGRPVRGNRLWANLYDLRNHLAHSRLPDIDEGSICNEEMWKFAPVHVRKVSQRSDGLYIFPTKCRGPLTANLDFSCGVIRWG